MGEWTRRVMLWQGNLPTLTSGGDLRGLGDAPAPDARCLLSTGLHVYISPCGAQHRALRPGRPAAGRALMLFRGGVVLPWPQCS
jgi:hypothetical protein